MCISIMRRSTNSNYTIPPPKFILFIISGLCASPAADLNSDMSAPYLVTLSTPSLFLSHTQRSSCNPILFTHSCTVSFTGNVAGGECEYAHVYLYIITRELVYSQDHSISEQKSTNSTSENDL